MDVLDIPPDKLQQFQEVRGWLAHLYKYCMEQRSYLITEEGKQTVEAVRFKTSSFHFAEDINRWHWYMVSFVLRFNELNWDRKAIDFSVRLKLPDHILLSLIQHRIFEDQDINDITTPLSHKEKNVLKEFALRLVP